MTSAAEIRKMSGAALVKLQQSVQTELNRRDERTLQLGEVRNSIELAVGKFGLVAEEIADILRLRPAKSIAKRRGRPPGKKTAAAKKVVSTQLDPSAAKKVLAERSLGRRETAKRGGAKQTSKRLSPAARSQAMKDAWARRKAAKSD